MALQHYLKHTDNYCGTAPTVTATTAPTISTGAITQAHLQLQHHAAAVTAQSYQEQQQQQQLTQSQQQQQQTQLHNITITTTTTPTTTQDTTTLAATSATGHTNAQAHQQLLVQSQHRLKQLQLKQPTIHQQHMTYHHHHPYYQQSNHHNTNTSAVSNTLANTGAANHKFKSAQHNQPNYNHNRTLPIHALNQNSNFSAASSSTGGGTASSHAPTQQSNATNSSRSSGANGHATNAVDSAKAGAVGATMRSGTSAAGSSTAVNSKKIKIEPVLSQYHQTERLNFANSHIVWGEEHWRRVVFQDERKFNLDGPDGFSSYFHDLRNYEQTLSQRPRGNSVYIYMLITAGGPIHMEVSTAKQRPQTYIETILRERPNIITKLGGNPDFILQDHNWTANMTPTTQEMLDAEGIKMQRWPTIAHDLNIMENIWGWLIREVYDGGRKFSRKDDLIFRIRAAWTRLPMDFVVNLYSTLPERIAELYYTRGIYTNC